MSDRETSARRTPIEEFWNFGLAKHFCNLLSRIRKHRIHSNATFCNLQSALSSTEAEFCFLWAFGDMFLHVVFACIWDYQSKSHDKNLSFEI